MNFRKNFRKISAVSMAAAALALTCVVPVSAEEGSTTEISVDEKENNYGHKFKVYQIFTGKVNEDGKLTEVSWGADAKVDSGKVGTKVSVEILDRLSALADDEKVLDRTQLDEIEKYANVDGMPKAYTKGENEFLEVGNSIAVVDGYYLLQDVSDYGVVLSTYVVKVVGGAPISINTKTSVPTVDKQVSDEDGDESKMKDGEIYEPNSKNEYGAEDLIYGEYWSESADHSIGERFKFRLTAQLPDEEAITSYKSYQLVFEDTLSEGITFDGIDHVRYLGEENGEPKWFEISDADYSFTDFKYIDETKVSSATWTIKDLVQVVKGSENLRNLKVEIVYTAHLNENAKITTSLPGDDSNQNAVKLKYSRNPNVEGDGELGETPEDHVFVFTYDVENKKTREDGETPLENAVFNLIGKDDKQINVVLVSEETETVLVDDPANEGQKIEKEQVKTRIYRPALPNETKFDEIVSPAGGYIKFVGVDAGDYKIVEEKAPTGYTKAADMEIRIEAKHNEKESGAEAEVTSLIRSLKVDDKYEGFSTNVIINKKPSNLPQTGGAGTFMIYVVGGMMVVASGAYVASKKKSANN